MNTDLQKAKGPAEAATSPSHGSNIPQQETKMNSNVDSTRAAAAPVPVQRDEVAVANAMRELENAIREVMHMSDIAANAFEEIGMKIAEDASSVTYRYTHHSIDQFAFLINNVAIRCSNLHLSFDAALDGEVRA
jgi:Na+/phosphate symporter